MKWAGGKTQLLEQLTAHFPVELPAGCVQRYVEPFIGGGAVFFHVAQTYKVEELFIADINDELVVAYTTIREDVASLLEVLAELQAHYFGLNPAAQAEFYYQVRIHYNSAQAGFDFSGYNPGWIERTAQIIFLNRTCFNGLFRVNSKAAFNVPFGDYKNPTICDAANLKSVSALLQRTKVRRGDFTTCQEFVNADTFVYFDPPYRPVSKTANFTSYSKYDFDDAAQLRLARFYRELHGRNAKLMLSNSDSGDDFLAQTYQGFNITRVKANRMINSNARKRGEIDELLITNYPERFAREVQLTFPD